MNEVQCEQVKKQMATLTDRNVAEQAIQNACTPHGGFLDMLRPYLDSNKRNTNPDGTTTDTLTIVQKNGILTINGKDVK